MKQKIEVSCAEILSLYKVVKSEVKGTILADIIAQAYNDQKNRENSPKHKIIRKKTTLTLINCEKLKKDL